MSQLHKRLTDEQINAFLTVIVRAVYQGSKFRKCLKLGKPVSLPY